MTRMKTTKATMNNSDFFFFNIILIICAALGANQQKYHGVSPSHPRDDQFCGNPTFSTNGRDFGTVYLLTYVRIRLDEKQHEKTIGTIPICPRTIAKILAMARAHKKR